jgi:hypothetical protein
MTILVGFHQQHYRNFKHYYLDHVCVYWQAAFPGLVSYQRFVEWMPSALLPLCAYLKHCFGRCSGISFIDSTSLKVCHNRRICQHRVFALAGSAWENFGGLILWLKSLHLVVNDQGELLNLTLTRPQYR